MNRPLPVTLVGGFFGAGKTSLLHHLISEEPGGHLAVLVESPGPLNPDLKAFRGLCGAMRRAYDIVEEFPDEKILFEALTAISQGGQHEWALVEVAGSTSPAYWRRVLEGSGLNVACTVVVVVDLLELSAAWPKSGNALHDFQRSQIHSADVLVLNKCDLAGDAERQAATRALRAINPQARIIETDYGEVPPGEILRATAVRPIAEEENGSPAPGFESVVYRAYQPFHPQRFWTWFNAPHAGLVRMKGLLWLATRNLLVGGVSRTGAHNGCGAAGIWWAALPREEWPQDPEILLAMQKTWREPYGDRRQELLLTGEQGRTADAARSLNLCLLTADEMALPDWRVLPDPFPAWDLEEGD